MTEAAAWRLLTRGTWYVVSALIAVVAVSRLTGVIVQTVLAVIIACAVAPLADQIVGSRLARKGRWHPARGVAVVMVYLAVGGVMLLLGGYVVGTLLTQLAELLDSLPDYSARVQAAVDAWASTVAAGSPPPPAVGSALQTVVSGLLALVGAAMSVFGGLLNVIFTLILALYFAVDGQRILTYLIEFVPAAHRPRAARVMLTTGRRLGDWVRGQLVVCTLVSVFFGLGVWIIGLPYAGLLAAIAFIGEFVPLIGPFVSSIPAIVVAFVATTPTQGVLTAIFCLIVQQVENNVIVPRVMSSATSLHPAAVMLAILAGNELAGAAGALLAVPVVGFAAVIVSEVRSAHLADSVVRAASAAPVVEENGLKLEV